MHELSQYLRNKGLLYLSAFKNCSNFYIILMTLYRSLIYLKFFQVCGILKVLTWLEYTLLMGNQEMVLIDVIGIPLPMSYSSQQLLLVIYCVYVCHSCAPFDTGILQ